MRNMPLVLDLDLRRSIFSFGSLEPRALEVMLTVIAESEDPQLMNGTFAPSVHAAMPHSVHLSYQCYLGFSTPSRVPSVIDLTF